jgi:hypothetical protein
MEPDVSPHGSQTVTGPAWPNIDEEQLASAAAQYEAFAAKLTGSVVPDQSSQLMSLTDKWKGLGAVSASGEATGIIGGHEANAAQALAIATQLRTMEATVVKTKMLVNATALEVQRECELISAMPISNTTELIQSRIKMGLSENVAAVNASTGELAGGLGVAPNIPSPSAPPGTQTAAKTADQGSQQGMQMMSQMAQMGGQMVSQLAGMVTQAPQQLMQPLQQLAQPLQQLMSSGGGKGAAGGSPSPFSTFSNHPLAGGSGAGGGSGMVKAASMPGSGGSSPQTPLMGKLLGTSPESTAVPVAVGASTAAVGGLAPVAAGGMGGGMGMMPHRGEGGGRTVASLSQPEALDYDMGEDNNDDW